MMPPDLPALNTLSARIGADRLLTQGAGGNTSLKDEGVMWIKASGTWLAHAADKPIMVPVDLAPLGEALAADDIAAENCVAFVRQELNPGGLRPSIETSVHATMPHRVVVHVHCVATIAWSVRPDVEAALAEPLLGLSWRFVPYSKPGLSLARAMRAVGAAEADVLVLGNHGLVVAAADVAAADMLLGEVVERLQRPVRERPAGQTDHLARLAHGTAFVPATETTVHGLATDPFSLEVATGGSLYPDHVIFLSPGAVALGDGETVDEAVARSGRPNLPMLLVPGAGTLLRADASAGALAMAGCLADVTARLPEGEQAHTLSRAEEAELLDWDAEKYRQALDKPAP